MSTVESADGTTIAYDQIGSGPALILVGGAADDGSENAPLAPELASHFTVVNYARRGRGASTDSQPYAVAREIEDLQALMAAVSGRAHVYGASSGGALALEAAAAGLAIDRLVVYEVPYDLADGAVERHQAYTAELDTLLAAGRRGDAFALAMRTWGAPDEDVREARKLPIWPGLEVLAPTLAYDARVMGDNRPPVERLARITCPTLVLTGAPRETPGEIKTGGAPDFFALAADAVAAAVPGAIRATVPGQEHVVDAPTFAPVLTRFLSDPRTTVGD